MKPPLDLKPMVLVPRAFLALLLAVPVVFALMVPELRGAMLPPKQFDYYSNVQAISLLDGVYEADDDTSISLRGDWVFPAGGISPSGDTGEASFDIIVPPGNWDRGTVRIDGAPDSSFSLRLRREIIDESGGRQIRSSLIAGAIKSEERYTIGIDDIPGASFPGTPLRLTISARERGETSHALVRRLEVRFTSDKLNDLYFVPGIVALALAPLICALFLRLGYGFSPMRCMMGGVAIALLFGIIVYRNPENARAVTGLVIGLSLAASASAFFASRGLRVRGSKLKIPAEQWIRASTVMLAMFLVLLGLYFRWNEFEHARRLPLGWDARGYMQIAVKGGYLYATSQDFAPWVREPMLPWLLRIWFLFAPATEASARLMSLLVSLAAVLAVFVVGARLIGVFPAAVSALMMVVMPHWNAMGVSVLRLDLMVLLLMAAFACRVWLGGERYKRAAAFGLVGASLVLTRLSQVLFVASVGIWEVIRARWKPAEVALSAALVVVLVAPHLAYNYSISAGDLFYSSTVHSRYYHNLEHIGEPGFPASLAEYHRDPYAGEPLSSAEYLLRHHSIIQLIAGHVKGYWLLFVWGSPRVDIFRGIEWAMLPGLLGAWVMIRDRRWWIAAWFAISVFPYAYITSVHHTWRLGGEAQILVMWLWAMGVREAAIMIWKAARRQRLASAEQ